MYLMAICMSSSEKVCSDSLPIFFFFNRWTGSNFYFYLFIYLFIYGCVGSSFLCEGFSLVVASGGHSSSRCAGLSLSQPLLLRSTGSRRAGSVVVPHGPSCSAACGIFPDQGSNPCPLHWQADSQPLCHQGSPAHFLIGLFGVFLLLSCMSSFYQLIGHNLFNNIAKDLSILFIFSKNRS